MSVKESQVEEVLATYPDIAAEILGASGTPTLISRQKILPSNNRIDLLFAHGSKLLLVELKVVSFIAEFLRQVVGYREELQRLQAEKSMISGDIETYLLCPVFNKRGQTLCANEQVRAIEYDPLR